MKISKARELYQAESEDEFKRNLRLKGFTDQDIQKIIEVTNIQPLFMIGVGDVSADSVNGVVMIYSTKSDKVTVLPEVDRDHIDVYYPEKPLPSLIPFIIIIVAIIILGVVIFSHISK